MAIIHREVHLSSVLQFVSGLRAKAKVNSWLAQAKMDFLEKIQLSTCHKSAGELRMIRFFGYQLAKLKNLMNRFKLRFTCGLYFLGNLGLSSGVLGPA
jgi:hypothetical protein